MGGKNADTLNYYLVTLALTLFGHKILLFARLCIAEFIFLTLCTSKVLISVCTTHA